MAYEYISNTRRQEIRYNSASGEDTRLYYRCLTGRPPAEVTPSSATITIFDSSGTTVQAATAMSIEGAPSPIVYHDVQTATIGTSTLDLGEAYQAKITVTHSGGTFHDRVFFDVVRNPLRIQLSDDLLEDYESDLGQYKQPGESDWSRKIALATDYVHRRLRQKCTQDGYLRPALLIGADQVTHWAALVAIESIYRDQEGQEEKRNYYADMREQEEQLVLGSLSYSTDDSDDPGDPGETVATGFLVTK